MNQDPFKMQLQGPDVKRLLIAGALMFCFALVYGWFLRPDSSSQPAASVAKLVPVIVTAEQDPIGDLGLPLLGSEISNSVKSTKSIFIDVKKNQKSIIEVRLSGTLLRRKKA